MMRALGRAFSLLLIGWGLAGGAAYGEEPDPALEKYHNANSMTMRRLYKLAVPQYREFLAQHPTHAKAPLARWGLALCLYSTNTHQEAADLFAGLAGKPEVQDQEQLHNLWGACLLELQKPAEAEKAFAWTIQNGKTPARKADALAAMLDVLSQQKKWADLAKRADDLAALEGAETYRETALYQAGMALVEQKAYAEAARRFASLAKDGKSEDLIHRANYQLGECAEQGGNLKEAQKYFAVAARQRAGAYVEAASYKLGATRILLGETEAGIQDLTAYLKAFPQSRLAPYASLYLGRGYVETRRNDAAEKQLRAVAHQAGPAAAEAKLWLARALARQERPKGDRHQAIADLLRDAPAQHKDSPFLPELLYEAATAEMHRERFPAAAALFAQIPADKGGLSAEAQRLQAFCMHRDGKYEESVKLCDAFLAANAQHEKAPEVLFLKAEGLLQLGKTEEAHAIHRQVAQQTKVGEDHRRLALVRLAKQAYDAKDWKGCLDHLAPLLDAKASGPAFVQVHFMAGDCHLRQENWEGAIRHLEHFAQNHPTQPNADTALFNLALAYQKANRPQDATRVLASLLPKSSAKGHRRTETRTEIKIDNPNAYADFCRVVYEHEKDEKRKVDFLQRAAAENVPEAHYYLAWAYVELKRDTDAIRHFGEVMKRPDHALTFDASLQRSILQIRADEFAEALKTLARLAEKHRAHPKIGEILFYRGLCLAKLDKIAEAVRDFAEVMEKHADSPVAEKAIYWRAWCERRRKNPAEAARLLALLDGKSTAGVPLADAQLEMAEMDLERGRPAEVIARLKPLADNRALLDAQPAAAERIFYALGWALYRSGDLSASAQAFERLLPRAKEKGGRSDRLATAAFQAGEARLALREYLAALRHFTLAEEASRDSAAHEAALLRLAQVLDLNNKWKDCQLTAEQFLKQYPQSALASQAQFTLGWALEHQKQYDAAIKVYEALVAPAKRDETAAKAHFQIGECLFAQGQYDAAMTQFTLVETRYRLPQFTSKALIEIGRILEKQGDLARAQERYKEVLRRFPDSTAVPAAKELLAGVTEKIQRGQK
jgi:TolA-binding protein